MTWRADPHPSYELNAKNRSMDHHPQICVQFELVSTENRLKLWQMIQYLHEQSSDFILIRSGTEIKERVQNFQLLSKRFGVGAKF